MEDPTTYPWSSCATHTWGIANPLINWTSSYLELSPFPKVRQWHSRALLVPRAAPH